MKPRSDAILLNLPADQQSLLAGWLLGGLGYQQAQARAGREFGVKASLKVFSNFYRVVCLPILQSRRADLLKASKSFQPASGGQAGALAQPTWEVLQQKVFELALEPELRVAELKALCPLLLRARQIQLREQELEHHRLKLAQQEAELKDRQEDRNRPMREKLTQKELEIIVANVDEILGVK